MKVKRYGIRSARIGWWVVRTPQGWGVYPAAERRVFWGVGRRLARRVLGLLNR